MSIFWTIVLLFFWAAILIVASLILFMSVEMLND
jgi:hypothetical protein